MTNKTTARARISRNESTAAPPRVTTVAFPTPVSSLEMHKENSTNQTENATTAAAAPNQWVAHRVTAAAGNDTTALNSDIMGHIKRHNATNEAIVRTVAAATPTRADAMAHDITAAPDDVLGDYVSTAGVHRTWATDSNSATQDSVAALTNWNDDTTTIDRNNVRSTTPSVAESRNATFVPGYDATKYNAATVAAASVAARRNVIETNDTMLLQGNVTSTRSVLAPSPPPNYTSVATDSTTANNNNTAVSRATPGKLTTRTTVFDVFAPANNSTETNCTTHPNNRSQCNTITAQSQAQRRFTTTNTTEGGVAHFRAHFAQIAALRIQQKTAAESAAPPLAVPAAAAENTTGGTTGVAESPNIFLKREAATQTLPSTFSSATATSEVTITATATAAATTIAAGMCKQFQNLEKSTLCFHSLTTHLLLAEESGGASTSAAGTTVASQPGSLETQEEQQAEQLLNQTQAAAQLNSSQVISLSSSLTGVPEKLEEAPVDLLIL